MLPTCGSHNGDSITPRPRVSLPLSHTVGDATNWDAPNAVRYIDNLLAQPYGSNEKPEFARASGFLQPSLNLVAAVDGTTKGRVDCDKWWRFVGGREEVGPRLTGAGIRPID